jgi:hypothetical protein
MAYEETLADRLRDMLEGEPGLSEKRMFGGLAFLGLAYAQSLPPK